MTRSAFVAAARKEMVQTVASHFHDQWREGRFTGDGYLPRWKTTTDESWIFAHGTNQVDIANTSYPGLPADWQAENRASATWAMRHVLGGIGAGRPLDFAFVLEAAAGNHDEWMRRHPDADIDLLVPFADLPLVEQQKDIDVIDVAIATARRLLADLCTWNPYTEENTPA